MKREFRIGESAMFAARGSNPLRLIVDEAQALRALLEGGYPADQAVTEVLDRVRLHEIALLTAMRDAVTGLLGTLSPDRVLASADRSALDPVLPAQRKARAWDAFEKLYQRTLDALDDDFDSVFGRDFARTYEKVVEELADQRNRQKPCP
jgi:type VI secretion system FHA domain protein